VKAEGEKKFEHEAELQVGKQEKLVTIYACHTRRDIVPMLSEQKELKVINEYVNIRTVVY